MRRWIWLLVLVVLAGMVAQTAFADDRLKVTGYMDNHVQWKRNTADNLDLTDNADRFLGRTRARLFFNTSVFENTKAVTAIELDQEWGERKTANQGFDWGNDQRDVVELKQMYLDFKIPGAPIRLEVGGPRFHNSRLKDCLLICMDSAGINGYFDLAPQARLIAYYTQIQEIKSAFRSQDNRGEDYLLGTTLETAFGKAQNVNFFFVFAHEQGTQFRLQTTKRIIAGADFELQKDNLFWFGVDGRFRFGNLTLMPTFIYSGGKWDYTTGADSNIKSFLVDARAAYNMGAWTFTGKFVYVPGNDANDNPGRGDDIHFFQLPGPDGVWRGVQWFEILGYNIDTTTGGLFPGTSRGIDDNAQFDQFGLIHAALRVDYKATKLLTLTGAVGIFSAAKDVGRPARLGAAPAGFDNFNYTGDDKYLGTEIDVWLSYQIFPKATVNAYVAYAFTGNAYALRDPVTGVTHDPEDAADIGARIIYRY
jgi:hypothetical protein